VFPGIGTVVNIATILLGSTLGVLLGHRINERTRALVTDALGLVTLLIAALTVMDVRAPALRDAVGPQAPVLIVLGSLLVGGICGSLLRIEDRLEALGGWLRTRLAGTTDAAETQGREGPTSNPGQLADLGERRRFIEGFVSASLLFCVGPLTILGSLSDGLGRGADQLYVKAALDGFAAIAFAASFGWGVAASVLVVAVVQGGLTLVGVLVGDVLPDAHVAALGATGGLVLVALALGLLRIRRIPVGDLLPALVVAPLLTQAVVLVR
jgi:uncharacterized membrane protein YqgA involved in biofilm formation